ncbi:hypothetical protein [Gardnerella greenwoodii]|uniref:LPXTG-motif protein cell wall anchor domain protein n=1 Tax=Gardnerella greenwoodii TaxID=2914925 RepID=A0A2N6RYF4_9BIFI|nr:hypothetical protein [Gardnerella greenwoodii]MDF0753429.1 hypothetical protein [Gardnerella greenwoodii]PMC43151.1 hypothetical protein CJ216_03475 [Gardnerella greenwoodii]
MSMQQRKRDFRKCTRRALFAFFVAAATVLATFAIAPIAPSNASSETSTKAETKVETKAVKNAESTNNLNPSTNPASAPAAATDSAPKSSDTKPAETKPTDAKPAPKQNSTNKDAGNKDANKKPAAADTGSVTDRSSTGGTQNSAEYYNPEYDEDSSPNITAGSFDSSTSNMSAEPISVKNKKKKDVKPGKLPDGTWFELKRAEGTDAENDAYEWANFEGEQCAASSGNASEENEQCKRTKPIPTGTGVITFRPNRWTKAGRYKVHVVVHYPDSNNTTSDDATAGNSKNGKSTPVYAYVDVVRSPAGANDLNLSILSEDNENSFVQFTNDEKLILMNGKQVEHTSFDATVNLGQGNISQRMICYKKDKNGNHVDRKYESGGINGLELKQGDVKVWKHASYEQQKNCFDNPDSGCSVKDLLYDDYVYDKYVQSHPGYVAKKVNEHTVGKLTGSPKESGDFACRVYALKNDIKADGAQDKSVVDRFDQIAAEQQNKIDEIDSALKSEDLFKSSKGITWESKTLNITVRNMSYYYQPFYYGIRIVPEREKTTAVPISACKVGDCKKNVRSGALPDGTWFEIANYSSEKDNKIPDWAYFEGEQSNKPTTDPNSKTGEHSSENSGKKYGKITVRISAWMKPDSYKIPVIAHYPDGSSSADLDSSNEGKPIYLNVTVENHPTVSRNDLQLKVRANPIEKITDADPDSFYDDVDSNQGVTMMRGMRFLNPYLDAWSLRDVDTKISLKFLCTKLNKEGKSEGTWSSSVNGLSAGKDNKWNHVESIKDFNDCKKNPGTCITGRKLYQRDIDFRFSKINPLKAVERTDSIIGGAPTETGDYQCAVYALKPNALDAYNAKFAGGATSVQNGDTLLDDEDGLTEGKDWTMTSFPIHVVEPFKLPKTGFAGWNMLLGGFATVSTCLMVLAFALDQTQWGRAFMKNFVYRNSAQKVSEIAVQKGTEVSARKGTEI